MRPIAYNAMILRAPYSGVEHAVHDLMQALHDHGQAAYHIYAPASEGQALPATERVTVAEIALRHDSRLARILWEQLRLPRRLRRTGAALLHAPAYIAPRLAPCPVVLSVYDLDPLDHPERCRQANRWHYGLMLPLSLRRAAAIIVPSDATRAAVLRRFPALEPRIHTVPLGVHDRFFEAAPPRHTAVAPCTPYILHVGNCEPRKNLPRLIEAVARVREQHPQLGLRLTGGKGWQEQELAAAITHHQAAPWVTRLGDVADADLPALYRNATCLAFPSLNEGFGLPPLEAMAVGCPVVSSMRGALAETCRDAAEPCDPAEPQSIAEAILRLAAPGERRDARIAAGHKRAAGYRWHDLARRVEGVYRAVLTP